MSQRIKTEIFLKIEIKFEEWVKIFDIKEVDLRHSEFYLMSLFRRLSKDYPKKVICNRQAPEGNIQKFFKDKSEFIKSHKVVISTIKESAWI
tara:strand:+ start:286 stop:561 length:276 start_codon:yes stop_codon:yes gene_type:complete